MRALPRTWRVALPFLAGVLCFIAAFWVGPFPAFVLTMFGIGFVIDALLSLMPTTGGMWANRQ